MYDQIYVIMYKCIIFSRVSTAKQTLEQQTEKLIEEALKRGYSKEELLVIQEKESATQLELSERIGLQKLQDALAENSSIECIIIYELSRLSRKPADIYKLRDIFLNKKINLIILTPYIELLDSEGNLNSMSSMLFGIFGTLSEQEGYIRIERVKRGIAKKKSEGKVMGKKMIFGYERINGEPKVKTSESILIEEIFNRFEAGESCGAIGYDMYLRGVFGSELKRGSAVCRVSNILNEERYCGNVWPFPAIVSKTQFEKCRKIIESHSKDFSRIHYTDKDYYCVGRLYTDKGFAMSASYGNRRYQYRDPAKVNSLTVNMNIIDDLTLYALKKYLDSGVNVLEKEEEIKDTRNKIRINDDKEREIKKKIELLKSENEMIEMRIIKKRLNEAKGDEMIDSNLLTIKKLEDSLDDISYENGVFMNRLIYLNSFFSDSDFNSSIDIASTPDDIKRNIRKYIERIIVTRTGYGSFTVKYVFKDKAEKTYSFTSVVHKKKFYDSTGQEISI